MRRWIAAAVCIGVALLGAGCTALPGGTDGDVTNGWSAIGTPVSFKPTAGTCHPELARVSPMASYQPVDCAGPHVTETIHVGTLTGAAAAAKTIGEPAAAKAAYQECSGKATGFVGGPWRSGLLSVTVVWPSDPAWSGGARWFRCDLAQTELTSARTPGRKGTLAKSLAGAGPLRLGCFNPKIVNDRVTTMAPVACTAKHRAEFAGIWDAPDMAYRTLAGDDNRTAAGCRSVIATYAGVPDNSEMQYRTGWISYNPTETEWEQGERGVRCFLWFSDKQVTRSLKGAGAAGLPIRYA